MAGHGLPCLATACPGRPCPAMAGHGWPWPATAGHGRPWPVMACHGRPCCACATLAAPRRSQMHSAACLRDLGGAAEVADGVSCGPVRPWPHFAGRRRALPRTGATSAAPRIQKPLVFNSVFCETTRPSDLCANTVSPLHGPDDGYSRPNGEFYQAATITDNDCLCDAIVFSRLSRLGFCYPSFCLVSSFIYYLVL